MGSKQTEILESGRGCCMQVKVGGDWGVHCGHYSFLLCSLLSVYFLYSFLFISFFTSSLLLSFLFISFFTSCVLNSVLCISFFTSYLLLSFLFISFFASCLLFYSFLFNSLSCLLPPLACREKSCWPWPKADKFTVCQSEALLLCRNELVVFILPAFCLLISWWRMQLQSMQKRNVRIWKESDKTLGDPLMAQRVKMLWQVIRWKDFLLNCLTFMSPCWSIHH